jgi:YbbR domain-containing protein
MLWVLNDLNKDFTATINYPILFKNMPKDVELLEELPQTVSLEIYGHGYDILSYKIDHSKAPIIINLKDTKLRKISKKHFFILGHDLNTQAKKRIKGDLQLQRVSPDSIHFIFTQTISKTVPIEKDITYNPERQYLITNDPILTPDSATISGPEQIIENIDNISTEHMTYKDIKENIDRYIPLAEIENISINPERTHLSIQVEKYTEASLKVPIKVKNLPDSMNITCIPNNVTLNFNIPISKYKLINKNEFKIFATYSSKKINLPLSLEIKPAYIQNVTISPSEIRFILEQK